jgi:hypothetical protein
MKLNNFLKGLAPILAVAMAAGVAGCDSANVSINGEHGKKLADLDMSGAAPNELVMFGPDEVQMTQGDKLAITVDGDPAAVDRLRFTLKDGTLGILREGKVFSGDDKLAVVHVTMPAPRELTMGGSGKINAPAMAAGAKVTILGSGRIDTQSVSGDKLEVTLPGSGSFTAAGKVGKLDLTILGSGSAEMGAVNVDSAKVNVLGSGGATFASDGDVDATIVGSGSVTIKGRARCKVSAIGSGQLICEAGVTKSEDVDADESPAAPPAPQAPTPP